MKNMRQKIHMETTVSLTVCEYQWRFRFTLSRTSFQIFYRSRISQQFGATDSEDVFIFHSNRVFYTVKMLKRLKPTASFQSASGLSLFQCTVKINMQRVKSSLCNLLIRTEVKVVAECCELWRRAGAGPDLLESHQILIWSGRSRLLFNFVSCSVQ